MSSRDRRARAARARRIASPQAGHRPLGVRQRHHPAGGVADHRQLADLGQRHQPLVGLVVRRHAQVQQHVLGRVQPGQLKSRSRHRFSRRPTIGCTPRTRSSSIDRRPRPIRAAGRKVKYDTGGRRRDSSRPRPGGPAATRSSPASACRSCVRGRGRRLRASRGHSRYRSITLWCPAGAAASWACNSRDQRRARRPARRCVADRGDQVARPVVQGVVARHERTARPRSVSRRSCSSYSR